MLKELILVSLGLLRLCTPAPAADLRADVEGYVANHQPQILKELIALLAIPNVAADRADMARNAEFLRGMLARRGFTAEVLKTAGSPLVYGELKAGAGRTLLFYIHYDGVTVDPSQWKQVSPFSPVLRTGKLEDGGTDVADVDRIQHFDPNWRLYARAAADDKAPIAAFCAAMDALHATGRKPASSIRVILDGEEETASPSLPAAIERYRERLKADLMFDLDGPLHSSGRPTLVFGSRGTLGLELTVYGPKAPLHSGHYGNWVPNPALRLVQLLASMRNDQGRVTIPGFYDGIPPLTSEQLRALNAVPDDLPGLQKPWPISISGW